MREEQELRIPGKAQAGNTVAEKLSLTAQGTGLQNLTASGHQPQDSQIRESKGPGRSPKPPVC